MPNVLPIVKIGHPILTEEAHEVETVDDPVIQKLIDDMIETYQNAHGLGIAGPQVNEDRRIFIISSKPCPLYPDAPTREPTAMINPVILRRSKRKVTDWESCLSIPDTYGLVPRHATVTMAFTNRQGKRVRETFRGFLARVCQHEQDHLDGKLFLERLDPPGTFTREEYEQKVASVPQKMHA